MAETDEKAEGGAAGARDEAQGGGATDAASEEAAELRAEEESAKAMAAEVPSPPGYPNPGQEPPEDSGPERSS